MILGERGLELLPVYTPFFTLSFGNDKIAKVLQHGGGLNVPQATAFVNLIC
jgi:hypothetical protein